MWEIAQKQESGQLGRVLPPRVESFRVLPSSPPPHTHSRISLDFGALLLDLIVALLAAEGADHLHSHLHRVGCAGAPGDPTLRVHGDRGVGLH